MTDVASVALYHDTIVIGCDFALAVVVDPIAGQSDADVVTALGGGATAAAVVLDTDGTTTIATAAVAITAATRTLAITLTDTITAALAAGSYVWRVRITTAAGMVWPVKMPRAVVRALP
jgi:hypothetical protein